MANQFLIKNTISDMRDLSASEITSLQGTNPTYAGVELLGYYEKGDTPAPIIYYLSTTTDPDDGGSIIEVGGIKLQHTFIEDIDISYFGCKAKGLDFDNSVQLQKACDLKKAIIINNVDPSNYYFINKRIRLYNSIKGIDFPQIKVNPDVKSFVAGEGYNIDKYTAFTVTNKVSSNWLIIEGLDIDGWYDGLHKTTSEFEHNIHLSSSNNVIIRDNILRNPCGDNVYIGKNTANQGAALLDYCSNILIYNNKMINPGRCGVALVSTFNVKISDNFIEKIWSYVCPIDLEPNGKQVDLMVQSTIIENNTIIGRESKYAINVYGATDSSYGATPYPAGDYSTKDVQIFNNRLVAKETGVNITASWGKIANVFVTENKIDAPQMVNVSGTFRTTNIVIEGNYPYLASKFINIGTFQYTDSLIIKNNVSRSQIGQSIIVSRAKGILIKGNNIEAVGLIPAIRLANDVSDIKITGENRITAESACLRFNNTSVVDGFIINNNILRSKNNHIIFSDNIEISNSFIGLNDWKCDTEQMFLVNSPGFFANSEDKFFDGKREFYVSKLPSISGLSSKEDGNVYNKKISSFSEYELSKPEADKYMYFNGSMIGVGFKGEWCGSGSTIPLLNTKIGHRYTNTNGGSGNTFYIREDGEFRSVQTIARGASDERPIDAVSGFRYWDTSINKPVYWDGTSWVDPSAKNAGLDIKGVVNQVAIALDTATVPSIAYTQSEVEAILMELRDLKSKLRSAGILAS